MPVTATFRPWRILFEQMGLPWRLRQDRIEVLLNPGFTAPFSSPCPQATVFHDLQHKRHPENFRWWDLPFWNLLLRNSVSRSTKLICVSAATRDDLKKFYGVEDWKTAVVPHGVEQQFFDIGLARQQNQVEKILLCVSTLHPHKNLARLLSAFETLHVEYPNLRLVIAGMKGFHTEVLERLIRRLSLEGAVTITGWIPREQLYELYAKAYAFVYPSEFEGFGMPVSEALAAALPVACSSIPPLREIAGDHACYFQPSSEEDLLKALRQVLFDEAKRASLQKLGPRQVARLSWNASAQATLDVLREVRGV